MLEIAGVIVVIVMVTAVEMVETAERTQGHTRWGGGGLSQLRTSRIRVWEGTVPQALVSQPLCC